jgi:dsRNA-specific ribonuclease
MNLNIEFLRDVLKNAKLEDRYILILLNKIDLYQIAFTSPSVNINDNYELYENLGDITANEAIVWYFYEVFPQLHCPSGVKTMARLKINYSSSESYSSIANDLGFWPYIKATDEEKNSKEKKQKLLEDVFEAFIGVTKIILIDYFGYQGVGNQIVYNIIKSIFDKKNISLEANDLYDAKTRLKELFDKTYIQNLFGKLQYKYYDNEDKKTELYFWKNYKENNYIATGRGNTRVAQEKDAASKALIYLRDVKKIDIEKKFVEKKNFLCEKS